jgi:hypothetical protein
MLVVNGFTIKPNVKKSFPKMTYTKIYDISYRCPIIIRRMEPFAFRLVKEMSNTINNYINETYAMASFPLSYNFAVKINTTNIK